MQHIPLYSKCLVCVSFFVTTALVHNLRAPESQLSEATLVFSERNFPLLKSFFFFT